MNERKRWWTALVSASLLLFGGCDPVLGRDASPVAVRRTAIVEEEPESTDFWAVYGEPVVFHQSDSSDGRIQAFVHRGEDDWAALELRLGERVVFRTREVDYVAHDVVPYRSEQALVVTTINGPPGTCIWSKRAQILTLDARDVILRHDVLLGDYLGCTGLPKPVCGCGVWEANWRIERRGRRVDLVTAPVARPYDGPDGTRAHVAPPPQRIRLR